MTDMNAEAATALRKPFPPESVGKLPKGGVMLDYVGHAAVTDRLLTVDPNWSWEPFATGPDGLPAPDREGNLWIRLTVCGVTRIGVGDGKSAKERIGDALRNAAMRFGVALDLWAKENLVEFAMAANSHARREAEPYTEPPTQPAAEAATAETGELMSTKTRGHLFVLFDKKGVTEAEQLPGVNHLCGTDYTSRSQITEADAQRVITALKKRPDAEATS